MRASNQQARATVADWLRRHAEKLSALAHQARHSYSSETGVFTAPAAEYSEALLEAAALLRERANEIEDWWLEEETT